MSRRHFHLSTWGTALLALPVPAWLLYRLAFEVTAPMATAEWIALAVAAVGFFALFGQLPVWQILGVWLRPLFVALLPVVLVVSGLRLETTGLWPAELWPDGLRAIVDGTVGLAFLAGTAYLLRGHTPRAEPIELRFPFDEGTYWIVSGGSARLANRHIKFLDDPERRHVRGQARAVDLVELNRLGTRARGIYPSDPEDYAIFGRTVVAPCAGRIARLENDRPDFSPPDHDSDNPNGNYVAIQRDGMYVVLAHLKRDSIPVEPGDKVEAGDPVGAIGNSGNTSEPHLHIHTQTIPEDGPWMSGDPVPMLFDGVFPLQARRIHAADAG